MPEPRLETCHIPTAVSREAQDPRPHLPPPATPPSELPIPDLIDLVDFRVTFTINGVPYQMPNDIIKDVVSEKPKLPNLARKSFIKSSSFHPIILALPMLNKQQSPKTSAPMDPRRRSISNQRYSNFKSFFLTNFSAPLRQDQITPWPGSPATPQQGRRFPYQTTARKVTRNLTLHQNPAFLSPYMALKTDAPIYRGLNIINFQSYHLFIKAIVYKTC